MRPCALILMSYYSSHALAVHASWKREQERDDDDDDDEAKEEDEKGEKERGLDR